MEICTFVMLKPLRVVELFCGLGGMHFALCDALNHREFEVIASYDLSPVCIGQYKHSFPDTGCFPKDICDVSMDFFEKCAIDLLIGSPPCQPFTRVGKFEDDTDSRSKGFLYLLQILEELREKPRYVLLENVEGFENSKCHTLLLESLGRNGYVFQEFILGPNAFGIPNNRDRYFIIAAHSTVRERGSPFWKHLSEKPGLLRHIPGHPTCMSVTYVHGTAEMGTLESYNHWQELNKHCKSIGEFLEKDAMTDESLLVPEKILKQSGNCIVSSIN